MARRGHRRILGRAWRALWLALFGLAGLAAMVAAALAAGALLRSGDQVAPGGRPVWIHVASNGFHTDIVVPTVNEVMDWRALLALSPITRGSLDAPFLAFGWGSQAAYTQLGTLSDLTPGLLVKAVAFDTSVVHLQPVAAIGEGENLRRLAVTEDGYRRLVAHIEQSLQRDAGGSPILLDDATHGTGDAFLRGRDRFWLLRSCNVWIAEALRRAGRSVGLWTPLAQSLMWSIGPGDDPDRTFRPESRP